MVSVMIEKILSATLIVALSLVFGFLPLILAKK